MQARKPIIMLVMLIFAVVAVPASAEFYKYVDKDGKVHYTDDYGDIPIDQRPKAHEYEEYQPPLTPQTEAGADTKQVVPAEGEEIGVQTETQAESGEEKSLEQRLRKTGARLQEEYEVLVEERRQLEETSKQRATSAARRELVDKIKDFNAKIKAYEETRLAFDKEVEAYNTRIAKAKEAKSGATEEQFKVIFP